MRFSFTKITMVVLALGIAACSATPVRRSFKESWNDTMTAEKVRYKLMRDKEVKKSRMHVEVFRGQVTLTGRAVTEAEKARAETLAKSVKRVTGVENYVHVVGDGKSAPAQAVVQATQPVVPTASAKSTDMVIEEKMIVVEKEKIRTSADDIPATVPTVRVGTGTGQSVTTVGTPARKPAALKAATQSTKSAKPAAKETKLATVKKVPAVATVPVKKVTPVVSAPVQETPEVPMSNTSPSRVVGKSKTGLPWDGEVYEDDASGIKSPAVAARAPDPRPGQVAPKAPVSPPAPVQTAAPATSDDLAREAAQELEKLRQKK